MMTEKGCKSRGLSGTSGKGSPPICAPAGEKNFSPLRAGWRVEEVEGEGLETS